MIRFEQTRILTFKVQELYDLIADVESYPAFVPWCKKCTILCKDSDTHLICKMDVGFDAIFTSYESEVNLVPYTQVLVTGKGDIFRHLSTHWKLTPLSPQLTQVCFLISFSFKSDTLHKLASKTFQRVAHKMIQAFEDQAVKKLSKSQNKEET